MNSRLRLVAATAVACIGAGTSFGALFTGWGWLLPIVVTCLVIVAVNEGVRRSPIPSALGPLAAAVTMLLYVTATDAHGTAWAGFLPGTQARRHLVALLHAGASTVHTDAAPVPDRQGVVLLAIIGMAGVALVVDLCALTLDRAALAGPPLLSVYVVAALLTHHGVGWRPFLFCVAGLLLLLQADTAEARRRWGRRFGQGSSRASMRSGAGRQLGGAAIALSLVVPLALPGLHAGLPHAKTNGDGLGDGSGSSNVVAVNPVVSLDTELHRESSQPILTYTTTTNLPGYLSLTTLDQFNGVQFSATPLQSSTSQPVDTSTPLASLQSRHDVATKISVGPLAEHWAPAPVNATTVDIPGDWLFDQPSSTLWSTSSGTEGLQYTISSNPTEPKPRALNGIDFNQVEAAGTTVPGPDLAVPSGLPTDVQRLAANLKRATPYATALSIQHHFLSGLFGYDLNVPPSDSTDALTNFLFKSKLGYCQQYAAAMALLARMDGIPARVAVGFTAGTEGPNGVWTVVGADAHAWPELYFPGEGWLPFEPTPRTDGQASQPSYATAALTKSFGIHNFGPNHGHGNAKDQGGKKSGPRKTHIRPAKTAPKQLANPASEPPKSHRTAWLIALAVLLLIVILAMTPGISRRLTRRRYAHPSTPEAAAHAAWAELRSSMIDLGVEWPSDRSPKQTVALLLRGVPMLVPAAEPLGRVALAEQEARYAPAMTPGRVTTLGSDVMAVKIALFARAGRGQRFRAAVLPRSGIQDLRSRGKRRNGTRPRNRS